MTRRRRSYKFDVAAIEIAFAITVFGCGLFDAPIWAVGLAGVGMLAYWSWSRRVVLNRLRGAMWATATTVGSIAIISIVAGAYWLGLVSGGLI